MHSSQSSVPIPVSYLRKQRLTRTVSGPETAGRSVVGQDNCNQNCSRSWKRHRPALTLPLVALVGRVGLEPTTGGL